MTGRRALIIGAGPGGLTVAAALQRVGIEVEVFERAPRLGAIGAGFGLQANAIRALMRIGLGERVLQEGAVAEWQEMYSGGGALLARMPLGEVAREKGAPGISLLRTDYARLLLQAVGPSNVHVGYECVGVDPDSGTAYFANGRRETAALLVGADGHDSVVRKAILGDTPKRYSGFTCWRGVSAPLSEAETFPSGVVRLYGAPQAQFGMFPVGGGRIYWAGMLVRPENETDPAGEWQAAVGHFADWPPPAKRVMEATGRQEVLRTDIYDRDPLRPWSRGRAVIMGDAAHLTTPFMGQGCGIAVEDAVVLAKELSLTGELSDDDALGLALDSYEERRAERTSSIVLKSRSNGEGLRKANAVGLTMKQRALSLVPATKLRAQVEQSIAYDV
jgi:2-polyprenyl-6-methoxyphenol hydroxylase-like FAD-dependent oxidoreductase